MTKKELEEMGLVQKKASDNLKGAFKKSVKDKYNIVSCCWEFKKKYKIRLFISVIVSRSIPTINFSPFVDNFW